MSLIGDALRKARQEAAERENDRRGILFSAKIADSPTRSNLGLGLALGAIIAVIATVAGGATVWWLLSGGEAQPTPAVEMATPAAGDVTESTGLPASSSRPTPANPDVKEPEASIAAAAPAATTTAVPNDPEPGQATELPRAVEDRPPPEIAVGEEPGQGFTGMEDGDEVYILEADLGSVLLSLDFIVFRSDDPFVEINGVELHVGGVIDGYRVKAIEADRVRLSDGRRSLVLRTP